MVTLFQNHNVRVILDGDQQLALIDILKAGDQGPEEELGW